MNSKTNAPVIALYAKANTLLADDKDLFAIPLETCLTIPSTELATWVNPPTVKRAITDADNFLRLTNQTLLPYFITIPDPMTFNRQVKDLRPVPRMTAH
jgi:hypothetical protein